MKKLTTEVKSSVLVFHGKGYKFITAGQEQAFLEESNTGARGITIDGKYVSFGAVARIATADEFYNDHPELRPHRPEMMNLFKRENVELRRFEKYDTRVLELMREGVQHHIDTKDWGGSDKRPAQEVLENIDKKIQELKEIHYEKQISRSLL
jgi:hypothetical protein